MKKVVLTLSAFALVAMFAACGGPKSDGEKLGNKWCECEKLEDSNDEAKADACDEEYDKMYDEMKAKYNKEKDSAAYNEFRTAFEAAKDQCK